MVYDGPILDNHFHLNRKGLFLEAARSFQRVGGTDLVLVHCPDFAAPPETLEGHRTAYADTLSMAQSVRDEVGLGVRVVLGPHPAAFAHQFERWVSEDGDAGKERAIENYRHSIEAALAFVHEGQAHAIGMTRDAAALVYFALWRCLTSCWTLRPDVLGPWCWEPGWPGHPVQRPRWLLPVPGRPVPT